MTRVYRKTGFAHTGKCEPYVAPPDYGEPVKILSFHELRRNYMRNRRNKGRKLKYVPRYSRRLRDAENNEN